MRKTSVFGLTSLVVVVLGAVAPAQDLQVSIQNMAGTDGFFLTPLWAGMHNGSFDLFEVGSAASAGLEDIAEEGIIATLAGEFSAPGRLQIEGIGNAAGFGGAPVIDPGETATGTITPGNPAAYPFFSFASMVIPSNDAFIGNNDPMAHRIFNNDGSFAGPVTIDVFGSGIWDAGTEVNDTMGAAFSSLGGTATDEMGTVQAHPGLMNFEGTPTPAGMIGTGVAPGSTDLVARITISQVPEPGGLALVMMALAGCGLLRRRKRR